MCCIGPVPNFPFRVQWSGGVPGWQHAIPPFFHSVTHPAAIRISIRQMGRSVAPQIPGKAAETLPTMPLPAIPEIHTVYPWSYWPSYCLLLLVCAAGGILCWFSFRSRLAANRAAVPAKKQAGTCLLLSILSKHYKGKKSYPAMMAVSASKQASTSWAVFLWPNANRTVPWGNVPRVL